MGGISKRARKRGWFTNKWGAKVYLNALRHSLLKLYDGDNYYHILDADFDENGVPIVTVYEDDKAVCHRLSYEFSDFVEQCLSDAIVGENCFPCDVVFRMEDGFLLEWLFRMTVEQAVHTASDDVCMQEDTHMGGAIWKGRNLAGSDGGFSVVEKFVSFHRHDGWSLVIHDLVTNGTAEIICPVAEMPRIVSYVYNLEHASVITFIGENPVTDSYVVGMPCTRGRIRVHSVYKAENGKLILCDSL